MSRSRFLVCLSVSFLLAFLLAIPAQAQVPANSILVAGDAGYTRVTNIAGNSGYNSNAYSFGATGGFNPMKYFGLFGEFGYVGLPAQNYGGNESISAHVIEYGGAGRIYLYDKGKIIPYGVGAGGGARFTASASGYSDTETGTYFGGGGGALVYLGKNWGVMPEVRYSRFSIQGTNTNAFSMTGGLFYQFGLATPKK